MAEIHVQARKHQRSNPASTWIWLIVGILIIAVVAYLVYANKSKGDENNTQNQRNTPVSTIEPSQQFTGITYVMSAEA